MPQCRAQSWLIVRSKGMNNLDRKLVEMGLIEAEQGWFEVFLTHLKAYKEENGHCRVPLTFIGFEGYKLGQTVSNVRHQNKITEEQRIELDALGFVWGASHIGVWWPEFIRHLKVYKTEHGHCAVPQLAAGPEGYKIGKRVNGIRTGLLKITKAQRTELEAQGFVWNASLYGAWWPEFIQHLRAFQTEHGHCLVPQAHICPDGYKLGRTVGCIRTGASKITKAQRAELDALGFVWDASTVWWPEFLQHLRAFVAEQGHCLVPLAHVYPDGYKIGKRVNGIRSGRLKFTEEQRAELDALGFVWDASTTGKWYSEFLQHLRAFVTDQEHCLVPLRHICSNGYKLGQKVSDVRCGHNKITNAQRAELTALGFLWDARKSKP